MDLRMVVVAELFTAPSPCGGNCTKVQSSQHLVLYRGAPLKEGIPLFPAKIFLWHLFWECGKERERSECCPKEEGEATNRTRDLRDPGALRLLLVTGTPSPEEQGICQCVGDEWLSLEWNNGLLMSRQRCLGH